MRFVVFHALCKVDKVKSVCEPFQQGVLWKLDFKVRNMSQAKGSVGPEQPQHVYGAPQSSSAAPRYAPGIEVVEGVPVREPLPCCGLGFGWTLFILGFFITIPWYIGAVLLIYVIRKKDYREKPGCIACLVGAVIITIIIILQLVGVLHFNNYSANH